MKCVLRAWGQLKRGFEVLALCFEGMCQTPFSTAPMPSKTHFTHANTLKRGFEVLALGEMCFEGMGATVEKGVGGVGTG